jgi:hypothetical protein
MVKVSGGPFAARKFAGSVSVVGVSMRRHTSARSEPCKVLAKSIYVPMARFAVLACMPDK